MRYRRKAEPGSIDVAEYYMGETIAIIIALIFAALVLLLLEILTPSFGVLAAMAIAALAAAVYFGFTIHSTLGVVMILAMLVGIPVYLVYLVKVLPKTPLGRRLFLRNRKASPGEGTPEAVHLLALVGKTGTAETLLRPSGSVRIDGQRVDAIAESGMIEKDTPVKVIRARGTDVIVRVAETKN